MLDLPLCCLAVTGAHLRRLKLNEAVEFDDQGREDIRYLAHQIEEAIMCILMCIIVTFIYVVT
jgi:hypothetical protein